MILSAEEFIRTRAPPAAPAGRARLCSLHRAQRPSPPETHRAVYSRSKTPKPPFVSKLPDSMKFLHNSTWEHVSHHAKSEGQFHFCLWARANVPVCDETRDSDETRDTLQFLRRRMVVTVADSFSHSIVYNDPWHIVSADLLGTRCC